MFTILKNRLSSEDIKLFQKSWDPNNPYLKKHPRYPTDPTPTEAIWLTPADPAWQLVAALVEELCPGQGDFVCAYERQYTPIPIHVDPGKITHSMIIPMIEDPRCQTLVWKKSFETIEDFESWSKNWTLDANPGLTNYKHSETYDLSNLWNPSAKKGFFLGDYYELDGVFSYHVGDVAFFMGKQMHCSTNYKKYPDRPYKDFVAIHVRASS